MKKQNNYSISPFGGYNFVIEEFDKIGIDNLQDNLPYIPAQSKYNWKDILYIFCVLRWPV